MKQIYLVFILSFLVILVQGQVINGSFENSENPDLTGWEWTCFAQSLNSAPEGGGNWCINVWGGNFQGCFPGYAFQRLYDVTDGQTFNLSGWAYSETSSPIGLYFGKINNGTITLLAGDTTTSNSWKELHILSSFSLSPGDTALIVLSGGITSGPLQDYGYFDLIDLQPASGINPFYQEHTIEIFPNPFNYHAVLNSKRELSDVTLIIANFLGHTVREYNNVTGHSISLNRDNLTSGMYFVILKQDNKVITIKKIIICD